MPKRSSSLFIKFALLILFYFCAVALLLGLSFWLAGKAEDRRDALELGESTLDSLVQLIQLQGIDAQWLQPYIFALGTGPRILDIYVCNAEGTILAGAQLPNAGKPCYLDSITEAQQANTSYDENVLRIIQPIRSINLRHSLSGVAVIELDLKKNFRVTLWENQNLLLLLLLSIFSLVTVLYFFIHIILINKLQTLQNAALRIAQGDFSVQLPSRSSDELDVLADTFNSMASTLNETVVSMNYFNSVIRSVGEILLVLDNTGRVKLANQAALRILGYEEKDLYQVHVRDLCADPPDLLLPAAGNADTASPHPFGAELELVTTKGERIPVLFSLSVITGDSNSSQGYVCVAQDIRERKKTEEEIRQMNDHLQSVNTKLRHTQAQLVQSAKLASLGEMATGITHELNQPLLVINLNAQMGIKLLKQAKSAEVTEYLTTIMQQVDRASAIINHLKIFGRKSEKTQREPDDINRIVRESFILFHEQLRLQGIKVNLEFAENLPLVDCNRIQVEQVITNLLTNARDAMEKSVEKILTVRTRREGEWLIVEIADTGQGINPDIRQQIFDPFFTTKEIGKGTGLGLAISYGIMKEHNGSLEFDSEPGKGTVFRINFPVPKVV